MFITLKFQTYKELIPLVNIIKFSIDNSNHKYWLTFTEVAWSQFGVINKVVEIDQQSQPLAFGQIQKYLESNL
jgi:hypothetical protein